MDWITKEIAEHPDALDQTRRAHDLERDRAEAIEKKASSVATLCLTLLATALAIAGYELAYVREHLPVRWWILAPAAAAVVCLALATIGALEVQPVGIYQWEGAEPIAREPPGDLALVRAEEVGRQLARWTAAHKADALLQVRAWLSRALVALIISAFIAIALASRPAATGYVGVANRTPTTPPQHSSPSTIPAPVSATSRPTPPASR